jgi:SAM-dependent methyltransferase
MTYADITIRDRNPIKRWLHRRRFSDALTAIKDRRRRDGLRILDFGAGNGELVRQLAGIAPIEAWVYEPTPSLMAEARENLSGLDGVAFVDSLGSVESAVFDYVFCLEVFEHLPDKETINAIMEIHRLLKPDGVAVIGVPHEVFLPALLKGIFRICRRYGAFDASPSNIVAAVLGHPPTPRPTSEISSGFGYHFHHLGFDFRILEQKLEKHFEVSQKWFSPFPPLRAFLNSEVYFLLRKAQPGAPGYAPQ